MALINFDDETHYRFFQKTGNAEKDQKRLEKIMKGHNIRKSMIPDSDEKDISVDIKCSQCGKIFHFDHVDLVTYHAWKQKQAIYSCEDVKMYTLVEIETCRECSEKTMQDEFGVPFNFGIPLNFD